MDAPDDITVCKSVLKLHDAGLLQSPPKSWRSYVWRYFKVVLRKVNDDSEKVEPTDFVVCVVCGKQINRSNGIKKVQSHIEHKHPTLPVVEPESKKARTTQATLDVGFSRSRQTVAHQDMVMWVVDDQRPLGVVEDRGFVRLMDHLGVTPISRRTLTERIERWDAQMVKELAEELSHISRLSLTADAWTSDRSDGYDCIVSHWRFELQTWDGSGLTGSMNSYAVYRYVAVTGHFVHANRLQSVCLAVVPDSRSHSAEQLANDMAAVLDELQFSGHLTSVTRDNGANFKKAVEVLFAAIGETERPRYDIPCSAHTIQLAVEDAVKEVKDVKDLLDRIKQLASHVKNTTSYERRVEKEAIRLSLTTCKLRCRVETRWSSWLSVVSSALALKEPLLILREEEQTAHEGKMEKYNRQQAGARSRGRPMHAPTTPRLLSLVPSRSSPDWLVLEQLEKVLRQLADVTTAAEGEFYPTLSLTTVLIRRLHRSVLSCPVGVDAHAELAVVQQFRQQLQHKLADRFRTVPDAGLVAVVLDPRVRWCMDRMDAPELFTAEERERAYSLLEVEVVLEKRQRKQRGPQPDGTRKRDSDGRLVASISDLDREFEDYLNTTRTTDVEKEAQALVERWRNMHVKIPIRANMLQFWEERVQSEPELSSLGRAYAAIPATSAASERTFSASKVVSTGRRARTSSSHVQALTRLRQNRRQANTLQSLHTPPS